MRIKFRFFLFIAKSPSDRIVVRTTRADPRHHRKHRHQTSEPHFDDADERSHKDHLNSSPLINGETKTTSQVNLYSF